MSAQAPAGQPGRRPGSSGRFESRYRDGTRWTPAVMRGGQAGTGPSGGALGVRLALCRWARPVCACGSAPVSPPGGPHACLPPASRAGGPSIIGATGGSHRYKPFLHRDNAKLLMHVHMNTVLENGNWGLGSASD